MRIGVFDSGIGGLSVAKAIEKGIPDAEVIFVNDTDNVPYGTKHPDEIYHLVVPIFQSLVAQHCVLIVVACNTVSTTLVTRLRGAFAVPFVALEPMVKPAASITKSGVIAVCATPTTLASERYNWLKTTYGATCTFVEPDCSDWSYLIEHDHMNESTIRKRLDPVLEQGADVIVLGCTHYHWIESEIRAIANGKATVLQPESAIVAQVKRVLKLA